jgi:predicted Zn-dependent protease with MMP-like domain
MTKYFQIPINVGTPQRFNITLGQVEYQMTLKHWDADDIGWTLDIADGSGNPILDGIPLVTGADLLAQYAHLGFGGRLWVQTLSDPDAVPTFDNLGDDGLLYWVTN